MAIAAFIIIGVGVLLILVGVYVSLHDWNATQRRAVGNEALGASLDGLAKLAEALKRHTLGKQLIILGIAVLIVGGVIGGVGAL